MLRLAILCRCVDADPVAACAQETCAGAPRARGVPPTAELQARKSAFRFSAAALPVWRVRRGPRAPGLYTPGSQTASTSRRLDVAGAVRHRRPASARARVSPVHPPASVAVPASVRVALEAGWAAAHPSTSCSQLRVSSPTRPARRRPPSPDLLPAPRRARDGGLDVTSGHWALAGPNCINLLMRLLARTASTS